MDNRIDLDTIGYFLYMEEQEESERRSGNDNTDADENEFPKNNVDSEKKDDP